MKFKKKKKRVLSLDIHLLRRVEIGVILQVSQLVGKV